MENERLKNAFSLSHKVTCYIPATTDAAAEIDNTEIVEYAASMLSDKFGGATIIRATGAWNSDVYGLILENTTIVYAFCDAGSLEKSIDDVINFMLAIKDDLKQESVALEVDNILYFL